jgi:benzoyl-CoA reductase/2-hydroxyglutaryl-CoA dehydratase subunit BcrC/BadD/HgdB
MTDYRSMWTELDLDLDKHDMLLQALPGMYEGIFLTQQNRPESMAYFDFVIGEIHGLRVKELMDHKAKGGKVVGLFCVFVPEDLILASGAVGGLCAGTQFSVPDAEDVLPRNTCALIKSSFGFKVGRTCPYVQASDFVIGEITCDGKKKMYELLAEYHPTYVMEVPQMKSEPDRQLLRAEYRRFMAELEAVTGVTITAERLKRAIGIVNNRRRALHRLSALRAANPAPIWPTPAHQSGGL